MKMALLLRSCSLGRAMTTMCCHTAVAVVSGKCGGNAANATDITEASKGSDKILAESGSWQDTLEASDPTVTFQYACGTGKTLKANPATIPLSGANAAAKTAVCCDDAVGTCAGIARPTTAPPQLSPQCHDNVIVLRTASGVRI